MQDRLEHSSGPWKQHKYVKKVGDRYYYPEDLKGSKIVFTQDAKKEQPKYSEKYSKQSRRKNNGTKLGGHRGRFGKQTVEKEDQYGAKNSQWDDELEKYDNERYAREQKRKFRNAGKEFVKSLARSSKIGQAASYIEDMASLTGYDKKRRKKR